MLSNNTDGSLKEKDDIHQPWSHIDGIHLNPSFIFLMVVVVVFFFSVTLGVHQNFVVCHVHVSKSM